MWYDKHRLCTKSLPIILILLHTGYDSLKSSDWQGQTKHTSVSGCRVFMCNVLAKLQTCVAFFSLISQLILSPYNAEIYLHKPWRRIMHFETAFALHGQLAFQQGVSVDPFQWGLNSLKWSGKTDYLLNWLRVFPSTLNEWLCYLKITLNYNKNRHVLNLVRSTLVIKIWRL